MEKSSMKPPSPDAAPAALPRLVCFVNGIFAEQIGGGDVYFAYVVRAALDAGYPIHFFGGHALQRYLVRQGFPLNLTLTDRGMGRLGDVATLSGQLRLLADFTRRLGGTLRHLREVRPDDIAYAMSDYWFDTWPLLRCRARSKILYLGMMAPTLGEVLRKGRADVTASRLASIYYWMSQQFSLRCFRFCRRSIVTYGHPEMREYLLRFGYREDQLAFVANGMDIAAADRTPEQPKQFDLAWTGRVHPQKGIEDLLAVLGWLKKQMPDYRAVIIGKSKEVLEPIAREKGFAEHLTFSGLVSEEEKYRLLKASRVFVMPSRYESWGIVVGEALAAGIPVVAYDLNCYRPVFGPFVRYVKPFDCEELQRTVEDEVRRQRAGQNYLSTLNLPALKRSLDWTSAQESFRNLLARLSQR
jgi:glycosyltransferase involved in cell wall biosynthesis